MQLYIYAKSGHAFGLENVRRASALCNALQECDPILCTADYRAATFAKQCLDVNKGVGVDLIGNLPNVMERGDMLIYDDSGEASETMTSHMKEFCKQLYKVGEDIPFEITDERFVSGAEIRHEKVLYFSDDDYSNWFFDLMLKGSKNDFPLLFGHYFFFKNEAKYAEFFSEVIEDEDYIETIKTTKYLLTSSVNACIESAKCGNHPVYFKRLDKEEIENLDLLEKYNIPMINLEQIDSLDDITKEFENIIQNYPELKEIESFDISQIKENINKMLKLFEAIQPSLDYKF
jgi:hypothetical protein